MEKKSIKIKFTDWGNYSDDAQKTGNFEYRNIILESLEKTYRVELSDNPEVVFCGIFGNDFIHYDCIRVLYSCEEYAPNFNAYDYAITIYEGYSYKDRVYTGVASLLEEKAKRDHDLALKKHLFTEEDLKAKIGFCSYIQSNETVGNKPREEIFRLLNQYKSIDAGGKHLNTIGYRVDDKVAFESNYKFSISFLNSNTYTYQDRPTDSFAAKTIPIYYGNPDIAKIFNPKAFINCHDFKCFEDVVDQVKKIDQDDELYLSMLKEPAFLHPEASDEIQRRFDEFLINIIESGSVQRGAYYSKIAEQELYLGRRELIKRRELTIKLVKFFKPFTKTRIGQKMRKKLMGY